MIEALDRVLANEDVDGSAVVDKAFRKRGIDIITKGRLEGADVGADGVDLSVSVDGATKSLSVDRVLLAVGRAPVIDDIGLDAAGVQTERGFIVTDPQLRTNVDGIFAIGDVTKPPLLAHKA